MFLLTEWAELSPELAIFSLFNFQDFFKFLRDNKIFQPTVDDIFTVITMGGQGELLVTGGKIAVLFGIEYLLLPAVYVFIPSTVDLV